MSSTPQPNDEYLMTIEEVAKVLKISRRSAWRWLSEGVLPEPLRYNRRCVRWKASEVQRFLQGRTRSKRS